MMTVLEELRDAIPPFASWQIAALQRIFERYLEILDHLLQHTELASACRPLQENTGLISWLIGDAESTGSAVSYDRGAMELSWDIESLIRILRNR